MRKLIRIESVFDGWQPSFHFGRKGQFLRSIGIDPDVPLSDSASDIITSGVIRPVKYAKFSGSNVTGYPIAIFTTPKNALIYAVLSNGRCVSYDSSLGSETLVFTTSLQTVTGAFYYNNYIYVINDTDIARYGPLDGTPALVENVWTGATLGLQSALTNNQTLQTRNSVPYLNHPHYVHVDNKAYFCDYKNGQGYVHYVRTKKTTAEGDTNDGSTYGSPAGASFLPFNYIPMAIGAYGNDLVIAAALTSNGSIVQGSCSLFFWDTVSPNFYRAVPIPDAICTVLRYQNGTLEGLSGNMTGGVRHFKYLGGDSISTIDYIEEGHPPMQNAACFFGNRFVWGAFLTYPDNVAGLMAHGSKSDLFPRGLHHIAVSSLTATSSNGVITAVAAIQQGAAFPKFIMGGTDGTNKNLDSQSTTYGTHYFRGPVSNVGRSFTVERISIRLGAAVAANMTLVPKLFFDNESSSQAGTTINTTNYPNGDRLITLEPADFARNVAGKNNFYLELKWSGTALLPVLLPIDIEIEVEEDPMS